MNNDKALLQCEADRENEKTDIDTEDHDCGTPQGDGCVVCAMFWQPENRLGSPGEPSKFCAACGKPWPHSNPCYDISII